MGSLVAAGLVAGQLCLPEGGQPVQGVGDGAGGPAQDTADRVRGEFGAGVGGEMGRDEVPQLPGAGRVRVPRGLRPVTAAFSRRRLCAAVAQMASIAASAAAASPPSRTSAARVAAEAVSRSSTAA